jgi:hypothetical protein
MPRSLTATAIRARCCSITPWNSAAEIGDLPDGGQPLHDHRVGGLNTPCNAFAQLGGHLIWAEKSAQPVERRPDDPCHATDLRRLFPRGLVEHGRNR